jgi:hypothetical protein
MVHHEQAYEDLGLSIEANLHQVEKRYHIIIHRLRAKELRGSLSMMDEIQLRSVNQAYRYILNAENNRLIAEYREKHYGKYKKYSHIAEKIDHFWFYYKFHVLGCILLLLFMTLGVASYRYLQQEQNVLANLPVPDLSLMIAVDDLSNPKNTSEHSLEQRLLPLLPDWKHIESIYNTSDNNSSLIVLTENPDLYILDRDQFIKLLRIGYLRKLDDWGTYGIDLSSGEFPRTLNFYGKPLIAAVGVNSKRPENAIRFIHRFFDETKTELEANKVYDGKDTKL